VPAPPSESPTGSAGREPILIYGINYAPELIGVGRYTGELGAYLAEQGHPLEVVTAPPHYPGWRVAAPFRNRYSARMEGKAKVFRCPLVLRTQMRGVWRLIAPVSFVLTSAPVVIWRSLARRPRTVLVVEPTLLAAPCGLLAAKLSGARCVLHVQDLEIDAAFGMSHLKNALLRRIALWFEHQVLKRFDLVVTISEQMRTRLIDKGAVADQVVVLRNWVDLGKLRPLVRPSTFRRELGLRPDDYVVLYAGSIGPKQALNVVVDAALSLADHANIVFVIAGEGPEKPALEARGLPNVRFLPLQPEARLCELLNLADLHILPQHARAADLVLPSKLGGMLASGKPILVTADDGTELHEFLGGAACITPAGDAGAVAEAVHRLSNSSDNSASQRRKLALSLSADAALKQFRALLVGQPAHLRLQRHGR
jgi:colanic acid biosynthesis glycosyl transferase WcaI